MRILVTFAIDAEFAPWRKLRPFRSASSVSRISVFEAMVEGNRVSVLRTGIGRAACEATIKQIGNAGSEKPDLVISSGLAGALKDCLSPTDLFVPRKVRTLSNDANADPDPELYDWAISRSATPVDNLITMDRLVHTADEKAKLAFFGEAVDMESALIMSHFAAMEVPAVTIRAISDAAGEDLPIDFDRCLTPQGAIKPFRLVNAIVRRPGNLPNLVRFGRQSNHAAQKLAEFLDGYVASLPVIRGTVATT